MQRKDTKLDFSGQEIYVGVDVGKKDWKVCILTKEFSHKAFSQPPDPKVLVGYLQKHFPGAKYLCAYDSSSTVTRKELWRQLKLLIQQELGQIQANSMKDSSSFFWNLVELP